MRWAIRIQVHNLEPLVLGDEPEASNVIRTTPYVPGSAMLGMFAAAYLKQHRDASSDLFHQWFLSAKTRFENLYPVFYERDDKSFPGAPLPRSTFTCKDYPGEGKQSVVEEHAMLDCLLRSEVPTYCAHGPFCSAELVGAEGFYYSDAVERDYYRFDPALGLNMHNTIDDDQQRPQEPGGLFAFECLVEESQFEGQVAFHSEASRDTFCKLFQSLIVDKEEIYLGRAKRRHYGRAMVQLVHDTDTSLAAMTQQPSFDERAAGMAARQSAEEGLFSLTLYSDAILCDQALRHGVSVTPELLGLETRLDVHQLELIRGFSSHRRVGGFSGVQGVPKAFDLAVQKGSAFLFRYRGNRNTLISALRHLDEWGMGFRTNEGFGAVIVNDAYHLHD